MEYKCYKHKAREAVARIEGKYYCRQCVGDYEATCLNTGGGVVIMHKGDPQMLLIPFHRNINNN